MVAAAPEPVVAAAPEPVVAAAPEPVAEAAPEPVAEAAPEPVVAAEPEPVVAAEPEPVAEAEPEPVAEAAPEPTLDEQIEQVTQALGRNKVESLRLQCLMAQLQHTKANDNQLERPSRVFALRPRTPSTGAAQSPSRAHMQGPR